MTLHEFVLAARNNSSELQMSLMVQDRLARCHLLDPQNMTVDQFATLQESSAEIALYAIQPWILGAGL